METTTPSVDHQRHRYTSGSFDLSPRRTPPPPPLLDDRQTLIRLQLDRFPSIADVDLPKNPDQISFQLSRIEFSCYANAGKAIQQLRQHPETIDLVLATTDGGHEPVHIYYLAQKAPKFWRQIQTDARGMDWFEMRTAESLTLLVPRVMLPAAKLDRRMLAIIVHTMYARQPDEQTERLDYRLACKLLSIGQEFQLDFLLEVCLTYLRGHLNIGNCCRLWQVGLKFNHLLLAKSAYRFILVYFVRIMRRGGTESSLTQLTVEQFRTVIRDDRLNVQNEFQVWQALHQWIRHDCRVRLVHFWPLARLVRFSLIHPKLIRHQVAGDFSALDFRHRGQLVKAIDDSCLGNEDSPELNLDLFTPRIPFGTIFLYGGYQEGFPTSAIHTFDIRAKKWFQFRLSDKYPRIYHQLVTFGHKVYIIGGSDGIQHLNTVLRVDLSTGGQIVPVKPMIQARSFHCAVRYGGNIVVCGGYNGDSIGRLDVMENQVRDRMRSCELYDPAIDQWFPMAAMTVPRSGAAAAVLHGRIYVAGGIDTNALTSVEFFSMEIGVWTMVSFMHIRRRSFAMIAYGGSLYAIGGCSEPFEAPCLKSMERYNPNTNTWQMAPPMPYVRMSFSACVLEDKIFIMGGYNGCNTFRTVMYYHPLTGSWHQLAYQLPSHLSAHSAAVVTDLPNATDYTYYGRCLVDYRNVGQPANYHKYPIPNQIERRRHSWPSIPARLATWLWKRTFGGDSGQFRHGRQLLQYLRHHSAAYHRRRQRAATKQRKRTKMMKKNDNGQKDDNPKPDEDHPTRIYCSRCRC